MSLPVLVAIVAVGIALTVAAVHFTGGSRQASICRVTTTRCGASCSIFRPRRPRRCG